MMYMCIRTIYINRFGGVNNFTLDLTDNINIIEGNNESGKTTICSFIKFIFYGFKDKRERSFYMSWNSDAVAGYIIISYDSNSYRIERECTAGGINNVRIIDMNTNSTVYNDISPADVFLKMPVDVYDRTIYVRQIDNGRIDGKGIGEAIENLIHSADETVDTDKALKKLDDARTMLLYKNGKGGRIYELENEIEYLNVQLHKAIGSNHNIIIKENYLNRMKQMLSDNVQRQDEITIEINKYETSVLAQKHNEITTLKHNITALEDEIKKLKSDNMNGTDFLPDHDYVERIKLCEREIAEYDRAINDVNDQLDATEDMTPEQTEFMDKLTQHGGQASLIKKINNHLSQKDKMINYSIVFGILFILSAIASFFLIKSFGMSGALILIIDIGLLITAIVCYFKSMTQKLYCNFIYETFNVKDNVGLETYINHTLDDIVNNKDRSEFIESLKTKRDNLTLQCNAKIDELDSYIKLWNKPSVSSAILDAEKYLYILKDKEYELDKTSNSYNMLNQTFDDATITSTEIKTLQREYDFIRHSNEAVKLKIHETEKQLILLQSENESPSAISDKLTDLKNKLKQLQQSHDAYIMAYDKLSEASIGIKETASPVLTVYASELMNRFTSGKYNTLGIGHDLTLEYTADNKTHASNYMSAGTLDISYLSLRFALIKVLYRDLNPPVIFDESFARLDDTRLDNVLSFLYTTASDGKQILIFTSQKRDAVIMKHTAIDFNYITLGGYNK